MEFESLEKYLADARRYFGLENEALEQPIEKPVQQKTTAYRLLSGPSPWRIGGFKGDLGDSARSGQERGARRG